MTAGKDYLTYDNLVENALIAVPAFAEKYLELINEDYIDKESGNHIVFGYAYTPVLIDAIKNHDSETVVNMFEFLEFISQSEDGRVVEVCDQSVLEALNDEFDDELLIQLMGESTREGFAAIKTYML